MSKHFLAEQLEKFIDIKDIPMTLMTPRIQRMKDETQALNDQGLRQTRLYVNMAASLAQTKGEPENIRRAKAFAYHLKHIEQPIYDAEQLIGSVTGMWPVDEARNQLTYEQLKQETQQMLDTYFANRGGFNHYDNTREGQIEQLKQALETADAVLIGAGSGLSTSAGLTYSGERFERYFSDFHQKYGITDIYSGGFYPFDTLEEYWAWWSRHIFYNRYVDAPLPVYQVLLALVKDKDYFVLTTNVDHQFQRSGFDKKRLFYTQGDYGLWQCSKACHCKTYDNENTVRQMVARQRAMRIPTELIPRCPVCGAPMTMNLRCDDTFVQDEGWYAAQSRYSDFVRRHKHEKVLYLELGVGNNTPVIIKYPFWKYTLENPDAIYACVNFGQAYAPREIAKRSICLDADIGRILSELDQKAVS